MTKTPLICIVGPTGSGKTALALRLAQRYNGEIICADSRTVYEAMNIGTAKPTLEEQRLVPHYGLDVVRPDQPFTAADFKELAERALEAIGKQGKIAIMVGGTGLYVDSVLFNYAFGEPADTALRQRLNELTTEELIGLCRQKNINTPINVKNRRHLIRAIELGGLKARDDQQIRNATIVVGISTDRQTLRDRIEVRAHQMFAAGVVEEARKLSEEYGWDNEAMTGNIYPILHKLLRGGITEAQAVEEFVQSDMRLAKRQMTWFKRNRFIIWSEDPDQLVAKVDQFVADLSTKMHS